MTVQDLVTKVQQYDPSLDGAWLERVYEVADRAHEGQRRASGESYIAHPLAVADVLADLEMDRATIAAALLHDVVEDTVLTNEEVAAEFGAEIAALVDGVTKLTRIPYQSKEDAQVENLRKMFLAMAKDIRVIIIKLADRLHNMRTLSSLPAAEAAGDRARDARDLRADRAPPGHLARQVGSRRPRAAVPRPRRVPRDRRARREEARRARRSGRARHRRSQSEFEKVGVKADITGRPKHFYSIYKKMLKGRDFSTIYDLTAVRVIVDTVKDCYGALGVVHAMWKPLPGPLQRLHRDAQAQHVPVAAYDGGRARRRPARSADSHLGDAPHLRVRHRGALALQRRRARTTTSRSSLAALAARVAERHARLAHVHGEPEARPVRHAGFHLLAQGRRVLDAGNGDAARLRLPRAHRRRPPLRRREGQRQDRPARLSAQERRHRRDPHQQVVAPFARLALIVKTSGAKHKIKQWFRKERKEENTLLGQEAVEEELARAGSAPRPRARRRDRKGRAQAQLPQPRPTCSPRSVLATSRRATSCSGCATRARPTTSSTSPRSRGPRRRAAWRATPAASGSPASTTCSCGSRSAAARCPATRSWAT